MLPDKQVLAVCGLYCGACYHYRAAFPEGAHLLTEKARKGRPLEGFTCQGCRSDVLYIHAACAQCRFRDCAGAKGIAHCGLCDEFPCVPLLAFQNDGRAHHADITRNLEALTEMGAEAWLAGQERRWRCPSCGVPFSWYEAACAHCGASLSSYADALG